MNRILNWFRLRRLENDLDRELQYHIDRRVTNLIHSGLPEPEARRRVALELGGATQVREEVRDMWLTRWLRDFVYDLRFSARSFRRSPSFTVTAILSLALGIGATTALYSLIDQIVLRALPVNEPERLVLIDWNGFQNAETFGTSNLMSYPICQDLQQQREFFDGVFCRAATTINFSTGAEPRLTAAELVHPQERQRAGRPWQRAAPHRVVDGEGGGQQRAAAARIVVGARLLHVRRQHHALVGARQAGNLGHQRAVRPAVKDGFDVDVHADRPPGQLTAQT